MAVRSVESCASEMTWWITERHGVRVKAYCIHEVLTKLEYTSCFLAVRCLEYPRNLGLTLLRVEAGSCICKANCCGATHVHEEILRRGSFYKATAMPSVPERFKAWLAAGVRGVGHAVQDAAGCSGGCPRGVRGAGRSVMALMGDE